MAEKFDFISATDKPALVAFSTPDWLEAAKARCTNWATKSTPRHSR